jgi:DNA (cytosine-5)-methyltransferase 1
MNELHLFAGAGGGILGGMLCGHTCVCAVEIEEYPRKVLLQRQRDGILPRFPIWDDVTTFDGTPWRGRVDVVCGGFPCQDISAAGKGAGIDGARSGLWAEMARICGEVEPLYIIVENSPMLTLRGLGVVLGDLAGLGYDARWGVLGASHIGAAHHRERVWILADSSRQRGDSRSLLEASGSGRSPITNRRLPRLAQPQQWRPSSLGADSESGLRGLADGVANRVERLRASGNGQVPTVAALAWHLLHVRK